MRYIDLHCDTLMQAFLLQKRDIYSMPEAMVDLERLQKGNVSAQFFAIFLPPPDARQMTGQPMPSDDEYIKTLLSVLHENIEKYPEILGLARSFGEFEENQKRGRISAFLTIEDGRCIDGSLDKLEEYYRQGIRLISLTWNFPNCLGYPNSTDVQTMQKGLTPFGKETVARMNDLGMLVDVSHLSDGGFQDVADICRGPFVASHSDCRALVNHPRNLTDAMIRVLADKGGVAGVNFAPDFLNAAGDRKISRVQDIVAHICHLIDCGGEECAALGTDFDGITGTFEIGSPDKTDLLFDALKAQGISERQIELVAYKNALRVIRDVLK